ncbi:MAG TPA: MFS transporter [Candidatus Peribacterales bacterium]|nr:MFS transporter [Candidatus Peribacterales bacterium]
MEHPIAIDAGRRNRRNIRLCYVFDVLLNLHFTSAILVPFFTQWAHLSFTQMHLIQTWFLLWMFVLEVPTGVVADRFGKKFSVALGALVGAVGLFIYGMIPNFWLFLLAEFLGALSLTLISGAYEAMVYDTLAASGTETESKKVFGRSHSFRMTGILIAAPIGSFIAAHTALNVPMLVEAFALVGAMVIALAISQPKLGDGHEIEVQNYLDIAKKGLAFLRGHVATRTIAFQMAIVGAAGYFIIWLYQPLLTTLNVPIEYFGWFNVLLVGVQIVIASNFGLIEKIFPSLQSYIIFNVVIIGLTFVFAIQSPSILSAITLITAGGGFALTQERYISAHVNQWIPSAQRATVLSFMNMLQKLFIALLNPLVGYSMDHSVKMGLTVVCAFVVLSFLGLLLLRPPLRGPHGDDP